MCARAACAWTTATSAMQPWLKARLQASAAFGCAAAAGPKGAAHLDDGHQRHVVVGLEVCFTHEVGVARRQQAVRVAVAPCGAPAGPSTIQQPIFTGERWQPDLQDGLNGQV